MSNSRLSEKDKPVGRTVLLQQQTPELGCAKPLTRPYAACGLDLAGLGVGFKE